MSSHLGSAARRLRSSARRALNTGSGSVLQAPTAEPAPPAASAAEGPPTLGGREVVAFDAMDELLRRADAVELEQGYAGKAVFLNGFRLDPGARVTSGDPDDPVYREAQMAMYREIARVEDYDPRIHEIVPMNIEERVRRPAPFHEGSMVSAGDHLIAYGFIMRLLDLPPGSRVIEYGPGNGNIALLMATMGMDVTAIDIGPDYIEIIRRRAENQGVPITAVVGEFGDAPPDGDPVDAIVFYEAFHHSSDHLGLIRTLRERLAPGGKILFAGEPIVEDESRPWLGPWGVRLDGVSLLAMRAYRCLELGFTESYFVRALMRNGFSVTHHVCKETGIGNSWVAQEAHGVLELNRITLAPDEHATWGPGHADPAETHRFATERSIVTLDEDPRWRAVRLSFTNFLPDELSAAVAVGAANARVSVAGHGEATVELALPAGPRQLRVSSALATSPDGNEALGLALRRIELLTAVPQ
jgi:2-polyprenyl-3-methyl-5-hydroxy-6-metoxy-1,4-benzoquinol methylase